MMRAAAPIAGVTAPLAVAAVAATVLGAAPRASAQEALQAPSATLPSPSSLVTRFQFRAYDFEPGSTDPARSGWLLEERFMAAIGLAPELAAEVKLPLYQSVGSVGNPVGLGDLDLSFKWRIWRHDIGPVDTLRLALLGGAQLPTGTGGYGSSSVDPFAGAAFTGILDRHGIGAAARWTFTTGSAFDPIFAGDTSDDLLQLDGSYLYRLHPAEYGEAREAAWYAALELNTTYETDGDWELLLSPGLLIEAPRWAFELGVQLPLYQRVSERPELRVAIVAGLRLLF